MNVTIAGADQVFHLAPAKIVGDTIVVNAAEVPQPVAVRYGWANVPEGNLSIARDCRPCRSELIESENCLFNHAPGQVPQYARPVPDDSFEAGFDHWIANRCQGGWRLRFLAV